ncbi:uncharacterized protein IUM83_01947 [Phytophthora cinnamomi]|uniref:uncharacterized protein n=1 Tax=Phytophthora cinnamomi TaxID=4785 RepID=UPI00355A2D72|nr:hypothetical protein IUM83_01947 [Phytophthora cinnamomi]
MVPVLYAIYLAAIYHLPNRAYFSNLEPWVQLHFVLRNAYAIVQSTLTLWVMYVLQTSLEHVGTDYTFRFAWLDKNKTKLHERG